MAPILDVHFHIYYYKLSLICNLHSHRICLSPGYMVSKSTKKKDHNLKIKIKNPLHKLIKIN